MLDCVLIVVALCNITSIVVRLNSKFMTVEEKGTSMTFGSS